jgi:TolB protein
LVLCLALTATLSARENRSAAGLVRLSIPPSPLLGVGLQVPSSSSSSAAGEIYLPLVAQNLPLAEKIAFETLRDGNYEIYLMDPDGSNETNLTNHPANDVAPAWSPDGHRLAFVSDREGNGEIYIMDRDGSGIVRLTYNSADDGWPTWSPDGTRIAFQSDRRGNWDIYVMNADGSGQTLITNDGADDRWPDWGGDPNLARTSGMGGGQIVFVSSRIENYKKIFVMNPDGGNVTLLYPSGYWRDRYPTWSPDGRIAFTSNQPALTDGSRDDEIYIIGANGSRMQQLTNNDAGDWLARWSPDGARFAFYSDRDGNKNIYAQTLATGAEVRLTEHPSDDEYPAWSP